MLKILISVPLSDAVAILVPWIFICMHEILQKKIDNFSSISRNFYVFFVKIEVYLVSWATIEIGWLSGWAKSTIWTRPTPDAEILLLTTADTACSDVIGKANKALSEVGDSEHSPFGFGAVSYLKKWKTMKIIQFNCFFQEFNNPFLENSVIICVKNEFGNIESNLHVN